MTTSVASNFCAVLLLGLGSVFSAGAQGLQRIGHLSFAPRILAGCWHHVDAQGGEWALVGTNQGLSIVDLRDPTQPVERFNVPGLPNGWREVRTWQGYAYVCTMAPGSSITIVNLNQLPDTVSWKVWTGNGFWEGKVSYSHTLQIKDGYLYLMGGGNITPGTIIARLTDPWNPQILSKYPLNYVHDVCFRGDTMWTCEINSGQFGAVDLSDIANPFLLNTHPSPAAKSHSCAVSENGHTLFHTDEVDWGPLASFDISNIENIRLLDQYYPSLYPIGEVHNVYVMPEDFLVCPSYRGQLSIVDGSRPENLIEIALDTLGTSLVWDANPYLPSGILFATARSAGLYVYKPSYAHAAWLEGRVTDVQSGQSILGAKVFVLGTPNADTTDLGGQYRTGAGKSGLYNVRVEKNGYQILLVEDVELNSGVLLVRDFALKPVNSGNDPLLLGKDKMRAIPIPFHDYIQVEVLQESLFWGQLCRFSLFDLQGREVWSQLGTNEGTMTLQNLGGLPKGVYLLRAQSLKYGTEFWLSVLK